MARVVVEDAWRCTVNPSRVRRLLASGSASTHNETTPDERRRMRARDEDSGLAIRDKETVGARVADAGNGQECMSSESKQESGISSGNFDVFHVAAGRGNGQVIGS